MASTSTNKQPLLADRPLFVMKDTSGLLVGTLPPNTAVDPQTSAGVMLVDCTKNDGAIIEHLWTISREVNELSYEYDPAKVPPNPAPPDATYIGDLNITGGGVGSTKTYEVEITDKPNETPAESLEYKWTVLGEGAIQGVDDTASVEVKLGKGKTQLTVKVTSSESTVVNSPQFQTIEIDFAGNTGGVVSALDKSILPTSGVTYVGAGDIPTTTSGEGVGLTVTTVVTTGNITDVSITNGGTGYAAGETVTLAGTDMGATDSDDVTFTIQTASSLNKATRSTAVRTIKPYEDEDESEEWEDPNPPVLLGYIVNFYMCPSNTVFTPEAAYYIGSITAGTAEGEKSTMLSHPEVLAPVMALGSVEEEGGEVRPTYARALYIPKGQCLWAAAVQQYLADGKADTASFTPLVGVQGGYY